MDHEKAHRLVRSAVERGELVRPDECSKCGAAPKRKVDGKSAIQGHHEDYNKPLDVEWICAKCHRAVTPLPEVMGAPNYGGKNGFSKLKEHEVLEIRASNLSSRALGKIYSVDHKTILRAKSGENWSKI
ncbi:hypothetical protein [Pseudomonas sp.]|uniref:hypothetical protein n=1 Tax=Pseudomonas sp. TaxID=306 RepID=UPI003FD76CAD